MSRRARSLAVWATLRAYGRDGYRELVDHHIRLARRVGDQVAADPELELLASVQLNVVCFRFRPAGVAAFRPAISNWRTTEADPDLIPLMVKELGARLLAES